MALFQQRDNNGRMVSFVCSAEFRGPGISPDLIWTVNSDTTDGGEFQDLLRDEVGERTCWNNGVGAYRKLIDLGCPHDEAIRLIRESTREATTLTTEA